MKIYSFIIGVLFFPKIADCQINLDSLKIALDTSFVQERGDNGWNAYTIKYLDQDSLVRYIIPFNAKGEIKESIWGIALSQYNYDKKGREIERRYYDEAGMLHFSDWPPIIQIFYDDKDQVIKKDYFGKTEEPVGGLARIEFDYSEDGEIVEERRYNGDYELSGERPITRYEYQDSNKVVIESSYDQNGTLVIHENVAYRRDEYQSSEREKLLESRFWDKDKKLTMVVYEFSKIEYAVVKYSYDENGKGAKIKKYDSEMNLVNESWKYIPPKKK